MGRRSAYKPTTSSHQVHVSLGRQEGARRGSTVAAAPGITTKGTSLFIAISTYISHTSARSGRKRVAETVKGYEMGEGKGRPGEGERT